MEGTLTHRAWGRRRPRGARLFTGLIAAALLIALVGVAGAQSLVKPKMLVIFDTSGSMTLAPRSTLPCDWRCAPEFQVPGFVCPAPECPGSGQCLPDETCYPLTFGDGSEDLPGVDIDNNGLPDDSRMSILKEALATTLFGVSELEFGLMRFTQREGAGIRSTCFCENCGGR